MDKISEQGLIELKVLKGKFGNAKTLIKAYNDAADAVSGIEGWGSMRTDENSRYCSCVFETMPPRRFVRDSTARLYDISLQHPNVAHEWKSAVQNGLAILPRVILARETEGGDKGRRKNRFMYALCGYEDVTMKEIIKELGFAWEPGRNAWSLCASNIVLDQNEMLLSRWNRQERQPAFRLQDMFKVNPLLKQEQEESIAFLAEKWTEGRHGALDADDMGIGKTLTALTLGKMAVSAGYAERIVVLCKLANVSDWQKEWNNRVSGAGPSVIVNSALVSKARYKKNPEELERDLAENELIIVNYDFAASSKEHLSLMMPLCNGALVVCDEAAKCSNKNTSIFKSAFRMTMMGNFAAALSGTPLSKNIYEAWSIFRLVDPAIYPSREFYTTHMIEKNMRIWNPRTRQSKVINVPEYHYEDIFLKRVSPYMIRHEKDAKNMTATKTEKRLMIDGVCSKRELWLAWKLHSIVTSIVNKEIDWNSLDDEARMPRWQLSALGYLQAALDDPYTVYESALFRKLDEQVQEICRVSGIDKPNEFQMESIMNKINNTTDENGLQPYTPEQFAIWKYMNESGMKESLYNYIPAKARMIFSLIEGKYKDKKVVIFCTSSRTCDRTADVISEKYPDRHVCIIKGSMNSKERLKTIEGFKEADTGAVMVCTDAMAFGVNLQFADALIHYNLPWSTAIWKQRSDRIYRTGAEGEKEVLYLTLDHPLEARKIRVLEQNLDTIYRGLGIDMESMAEQETVFAPNNKQDMERQKHATFKVKNGIEQSYTPDSYDTDEYDNEDWDLLAAGSNINAEIVAEAVI